MKQISCEEVAQRLARKEPTLLLDVREPWEHQLGAIPGSVLIPLGQLPQRSDELEPAPDQLVVCYCHHGVRSLSAASLLEARGLPGVVSLAGGIDAWSLKIDPKIARY